ncbi:beta-ketoacyl-[acyl-carrier-protein] synthase family protein [Nocardia sp. IBHARD005]|uniref:beta-ketoacyl-[acyl-carrier-protein] synthase family protein n=1 Tax=Nocardia sp. IBHARD005 TaxID=3457765 RepID=UPI0040588936
MRRVVITGVGAVTPLGTDAATTWRNLAAGVSGIGPLTTFDTEGFPIRIAGQVPDGFDPKAAIPGDPDHRMYSRAGGFGLAATAEALRDADAGRDTYDADRMGVAMGATVERPDLRYLIDVGLLRETESDAFLVQSPKTVYAADQNTPLDAMVRMVGATGPMVGISTACSSSGHAIGEAFRLIQEGDAELMLAGGYESLTSWIDILGFSLLGAMTERHNDDPQSACRPFDADRSGFVVGEGAVVFVLEELESARARGARIHAEVLGYGSTMNAWRITDSPPDGSGAIQAMEAAIAESGLGTAGIDYVVAHGTGTVSNDASETAAIKKVFGDDAYRLVVSSPKSMTGHLTGAAAALNVLVAVGAMRESLVPPTVNLDRPDRGLDLDYVPHRARHTAVAAALVNAFAFGGTNISLVVGASSPDRRRREQQ